MEDHTYSVVETAHLPQHCDHISRTRKLVETGRSYLKSLISSLMQEISRVGGWSGGKLENEAGNAGKKLIWTTYGQHCHFPAWPDMVVTVPGQDEGSES